MEGAANLGVKQKITFREDSGAVQQKEKIPKQKKGKLFHPLLKGVRKGTFMK